MATKCKSCDNAVMNSEFITCAGLCGEIFHIKCVGVSKSMLTAVASCPNIHWYCHNCNNGKRNISSSVDNMKDSIDRLASSLSSDLLQFLNGFKLLTDRLFKTISSVKILHNGTKVADSENVASHRENGQCEDYDTSKTHAQFVVDSNVKQNLITASEPLKSVVVSNIGKGISEDYLRDYLVDELKIEKAKIHSSLLLPPGKTVDDMYFLQYKVTIPEVKYKSIIAPNTWPRHVRVRDFVYKPKNGVAVSIKNVLAERTQVKCTCTCAKC